MGEEGRTPLAAAGGRALRLAVAVSLICSYLYQLIVDLWIIISVMVLYYYIA